MLPVDEALRIVLDSTPELAPEQVALEDCLGRVLREDVVSDLELPPFDRAMMDGYAVRASETGHSPAALRLCGEVRAGQMPKTALESGQAMQVMTGAPVPRGADAVQQIEKTRREGGEVLILEAVLAGQNVAPRGSEVCVGETVLESGAAIGPAIAAVLATFGRSRVLVGRRPAVAVLVTGDELVGAGERPQGAQIRNSNGPAITAQAIQAGAQVRPLGVVRDELAVTLEALERGLAADVLVISGGVSEGLYDLVEPALARLGVELLFNKVAIKPGAPLVFGRRGPTLVFGLPGNPVSAQVTFDIFARAALRKMQGSRDVARPRVVCELKEPVRNRSRRQAFVPARLHFEAGRFVAIPLPSKGSADVVAHARANALLILDANRVEAAAGEPAEALLLASFSERG